MLKAILLFLCCALIPLNTVMCEYVFPGNDDNSIMHWWWLRLDIVSLTWVLSAYSYKAKHEENFDRIIRILASIWIGLSMTDFLERWVIKDREPFSWFDLVGIFVTLFFAILVEYKKEIKDLLNDKLKWHKYLGN